MTTACLCCGRPVAGTSTDPKIVFCPGDGRGAVLHQGCARVLLDDSAFLRPSPAWVRRRVWGDTDH